MINYGLPTMDCVWKASADDSTLKTEFDKTTANIDIVPPKM